jgi:hypothetical protein
MQELEIICDELVKIEGYGGRIKVIVLNPDNTHIVNQISDEEPDSFFNDYCEHNCDECDWTD